MEKWIAKAKKIIRQDLSHNYVVFGLNKKGIIVSTGFNSYKTHPKQKNFAIAANLPLKEFLHAEIDCLIKAREQIYKMIIVRLNRKGEPRLAKPCPVCELAIKAANVKIIEYTL